jgi:GTPase SAR1 family protein
MSVTVVNIDPGVEDPPYTSDVDIREFVDYGEIMKQFGLGPNGALVASLDMALNHATEIREEIVESNRDYILVDCPGQMELFAYRNSGPLMVSSLHQTDPALSLYLLDSNIARTATGYVSSLLLGVSINIRFGLSQLNVLSKSDILSPDELSMMELWSDEPYTLEEFLDDSSSGLIREYTKAALVMLEQMGGGTNITPVSAKQMTGIENLYGEIQRIVAGGEDYLTYE